MKTIVLLLLLATTLLAPSTLADDKSAEYLGKFDDDSTLTIEVKDATVAVKFSNKTWSITTAVATQTDDGLSIAGTGTANDKTLAISGRIHPDIANIEIRVGVGRGAKVTQLVLKKT